MTTDNANRTEAPTSEATKVANEERFTGLTADQLDFVTLMNQLYGVRGTMLTKEEALSDEWNFTEEEWNGYWNNEAVQSALIERSVATPKVFNTPVGKEPHWSDNVLEPIQVVVADIVLDLTDTRSHKKKLQDLGISTLQWANWMKQPNFKKYVQEKAATMVKDYSHEADLALMDKVKAGDINAIKYLNEYTGRYVSQGTNTTVNVGGSRDDFRSVLVAILEIIQDEVTDPAVAIRISQRFKELITRVTVADSLLAADDPIEIPEVRANRELRPELMKMLNNKEESSNDNTPSES